MSRFRYFHPETVSMYKDSKNIVHATEKEVFAAEARYIVLKAIDECNSRRNSITVTGNVNTQDILYVIGLLSVEDLQNIIDCRNKFEDAKVGESV